MGRVLCLGFVLFACEAKTAPSDDPVCEATLARATPCMDELVLADVTDPEARARLEAEMRSEPASADATAQMHRVFCKKHSTYPAAVTACTAEPTCAAFVACVHAKR